MRYRVKHLAEVAGVTVRTLHHYDRMGLLRPAAVTEAGYRLYEAPQVERLQQILFFRELEFTLDEIKSLLDGPDHDVTAALRLQRALLLQRRQRLDRLVAVIDETLTAVKKGTTMDDRRRFVALDGKDYHQYKEEAIERYGREVVEASHRRVAAMPHGERQRLGDDFWSICEGLVPHVDGPVDGPAVTAAMTELHRWLNRFFECRAAQFRGLGELYCADERFRRQFDERHQALADFVRRAMAAYAATIE